MSAMLGVGLARLCKSARDGVQLIVNTPALGALLFSRQNNVCYVHARSVTPQKREFIDRDAECRHRIRGMSLVPWSLSVMRSAARVAFSLH